MAAKRLAREEGAATRRVRYVGPYPRVSFPGNPAMYVNRLEVVTIPFSLTLCELWEDAESTSDKGDDNA